jgi:hypothetical protein
MRKLAMMVAAVAALLALGAGSVLAQEGDAGSEVEGAKVVTGKAGNQTIQCTGVPCIATGRSDLVFERIGTGKKDRILLKGGDDQVRANTYGKDKDVIKGRDGFDPRQDLWGQGQRQVLRGRPQGGRLGLLKDHSPVAGANPAGTSRGSNL